MCNFIQRSCCNNFPTLKELDRYNKISLEPGETKTVSFTVDIEELGFYNVDNVWVNEAGKHSFYISNLEPPLA